jgi:hypothetical protein
LALWCIQEDPTQRPTMSKVSSFSNPWDLQRKNTHKIYSLQLVSLSN